MPVNNTHDQSDHRSKQCTWDKKTAEWYAVEYGDHISNNLAITNIGLEANDILLDIGCGNGKAARLAAKICTTGKVIGVDPSDTMIRISKKITDEKFINFITNGMTSVRYLIPLTIEANKRGIKSRYFIYSTSKRRSPKNF